MATNNNSYKVFLGGLKRDVDEDRLFNYFNAFTAITGLTLRCR